MASSDRPPHLLHFRVSHYNEKVRWALDHKRWPHTRTALVPGFHVARVRWLTGQQLLPVLELDGRLLTGSSRIIEELERLRPDPPLYPDDAADRERALAIEAHFDREVAPDLRRLFWAAYVDHPDACARVAADGFSGLTRAAWRAALPLMRPLLARGIGLDAAQIAATRGRLAAHFDRLEAAIGAGGYLAGDRFSIADLAAAAVLTAIVRPPEFPYPLPEPWPPEFVDLRASVAGRRGFRWVLDLYARHRGESSEIRRAGRVLPAT